MSSDRANFPTQPKVTVIQDGARLHYAVPVALQRAGALERVFTDWYTAGHTIESLVTHLLKFVNPSRAARMTQRFTPELDVARIHTKPVLIFSQFFGRRHFNNETEYYAWMSDVMARWVLDRGFGDSNGLFGFVRNIFPGLCSTAKHLGLKVITDQIIAPIAVEHAEALKQRERFPGWIRNRPLLNDRLLHDFERGTWESSGLITCGSDYVRTGLLAAGVPEKKIAVVPYPVDNLRIKAIDRRGRPGPITVGFVGEVGLRKGTPYFFQVARRFDPAQVRFVMVGPLAIDPAIAEQHRGEVELKGHASRLEIESELHGFDIFLFPSTCEGSAGAVSEAMLAGLPIVTSPNSGSVVRQGIEGYICPYDDVDRMAGFVSGLVRDAELRHQMGLAARARIETFSLDSYGQKLKALYGQLLSPGA